MTVTAAYVFTPISHQSGTKTIFVIVVVFARICYSILMELSVLKVYFDNCCLNRPYDDLSDNIVRMECEAILSIINICEIKHWSFYSSDVLFDEILSMTNVDKQEKVLLLYHSAAIHIALTDEIVSRAKDLERFNIKSYDALHLASAEAGNADIFLTTDSKLIKAAQRADIDLKVKNPLTWLTEVFYDRES